MITGHSHDFFTTFHGKSCFYAKNLRFLYAFICYLYDAKNPFVIGFLALYAMCMVVVRTLTYSSYVGTTTPHGSLSAQSATSQSGQYPNQHRL